MTGLVPVIHVLFVARKTWMRGTEPAHDGYQTSGSRYKYEAGPFGKVPNASDRGTTQSAA
jgi:hypothetical protein